MAELEVNSMIAPEDMAATIANRWTTWRSAMSSKHAQWAELRNYIFATDTTTTSNASLPWKNKTTRPKLCQIRDNLHANYMAALFPNDNWFKWRAMSEDDAVKEKARSIEAYMGNKIRDSKFKETVSRLVYDYIDYGNCFADVYYETDTYVNLRKEEVVIYTGPRLYRISPYDIMFDITAADFDKAPKIIREVVSFGDLVSRQKTAPMEYPASIINKAKENRSHVSGYKENDIKKSEGLVADGFGSLSQYYSSGLVELLTYYGDYYDMATGELYSNYAITVMDRAYILYKKPIDNWIGRPAVKHCAWRFRPDNLMGMGPLDNLVGMQYRIDHLENLKADVFDMIAHPVTVVKGTVEDFRYGPNERIYMDTDASVDTLHPDTTALSADFSIDRLQVEMEEMAGAPKQAMGIRTPGEKTAFEVQSLENSSGRMFQAKISYFEEHFIEPLLNAMLSEARENIDGADLIRVVDDDIGVTEFLSITQKDLSAKGALVPMGARHFAAQAQLIQNLTTLSGTGMYQDQAVNVHFSGFRMAKLIEENLGLTAYGIVRKNARIDEQAESQNLANAAQEQTEVNAITPLEEIPEDQLPELPPEEA